MTEAQTCQCIWRLTSKDGPCGRPVSPESGEAMLCIACMNEPRHMEANNIPKRLPKRSLA